MNKTVYAVLTFPESSASLSHLIAQIRIDSAGVIRNGDAGGMSDLYQTVNVVPDVSYTIR